MGSPPLAWGILVVGLIIPFAIGITPTRMGNTFKAKSADLTQKDHPHSHGEY